MKASQKQTSTDESLGALDFTVSHSIEACQQLLGNGMSQVTYTSLEDGFVKFEITSSILGMERTVISGVLQPFDDHKTRITIDKVINNPTKIYLAIIFAMLVLKIGDVDLEGIGLIIALVIVIFMALIPIFSYKTQNVIRKEIVRILR